ncbi:hypothetical protein ACPYO6_13850 [Georgenia sp. Z1344]|uniref:hypothetical protein n=1 Tax=Georgenia sp. Z1344 TaxID=3416706 RepID=UPI003CF86C98
MTQVVVSHLNAVEANARRDAILSRVGEDEDAFRTRASEYLLSAEELALFDELESLDFLLSR